MNIAPTDHTMKPMRMTQEQLAEIEKRCDSASPAPWTIHNLNKYSGVLKRACEQEFLQVFPFGDACFIAGARQDIPALLSHVRAVESELDSVRIDLKMWQEQGHVDGLTIDRKDAELSTLRAENLRLRGVLGAICDVDETCGGLVDLDAPVEQSEYLQGLMQNARDFIASKQEPSDFVENYNHGLGNMNPEASKQEGER